MVDKPSKIAALGGINNILEINPEEVRGPNAHLLVIGFPEVCNDGADGLPHVLDDHLIGSDGLHGEQTPVVDARLAELQKLLSELFGEQS